MVDLVKVRDRSLSVRSETQAYLQALRAERAARPRWTPTRRAAPAAPPTLDPTPSSASAGEAAAHSSSANADTVEPIPGPPVLYVAGCALVTEAVPAVAEAVAEAVSAEPEPAARTDVETEIHAAAAEQPPAPVKAARPRRVARTSPQPLPRSSPKARATAWRKADLSSLDGVEAGLIWRLKQVGVPNVGALARSDADKLAKALGPVGRLINVAELIRRAQDSAKSGA
jgi:predicted flap endonuclease-1-like 5' DNA nuclease